MSENETKRDSSPKNVNSVGALGDLDHSRRAAWRQFMFLFCCFFMFENWSSFTSIVWEILLFSCQTPAVFCGLTKLILTFNQHEGEEVMAEFSFLGEHPQAQ